MARFAEYRLGRQLALQFLYSLEFSELSWRTALPEFWNLDPVGLSLEYGADDETCEMPAPPDERELAEARAFAERLIEGVCSHRAELERLITSAFDNWKPERVGRIEWVILRMALYEMHHCPDSPKVVVISEANRLATLFGDVEAPRFISGVLNRLLDAGKDTGDDDSTQEVTP